MSASMSRMTRDPVNAALRGDLDPVVLAIDIEVAAVVAQPCPGRDACWIRTHLAGLDHINPDGDEELDHLVLVLVGVLLLLDQRVELGVRLEYRLTLSPRRPVERARTREQVFDVERRESDHHGLPALELCKRAGALAVAASTRRNYAEPFVPVDP
jgi:hypothetical protein